MSEPFLGEIRMFGGNFAPTGWAMCNGQLMSISQNTALFALLGTTYGGDGVTTFELPDLQGRLPIHQGTDPSGNSYVIGQRAGEEFVTLTVNQMPSHAHQMVAASDASSQSLPVGNLTANTTAAGVNLYGSGTAAAMAPAAINSVGGSQPHDNSMPFVVVNFIIALEGIFPSRS